MKNKYQQISDQQVHIFTAEFKDFWKELDENRKAEIRQHRFNFACWFLLGSFFFFMLCQIIRWILF